MAAVARGSRPNVGDDMGRVASPLLMHVAGTNGLGRDGCRRVAERRQISPRGYVEAVAEIEFAPDAVGDRRFYPLDVYVDDEWIGCLHAAALDAVDSAADGIRSVPVQIFTEAAGRGLRAEVWVWLGRGTAAWVWAVDRRPPMTLSERAVARQRDAERLVRDAVSVPGTRGEHFRAGIVNGRHYLELVEPIRGLKREGRLEEALGLCYQAMEGVEAAARAGAIPLPSWYAQQAGIILRKLHRYDEEVAVLEGWLEMCPPDMRDGSTIDTRLKNLLEATERGQGRVR